MIYLYRFDVRTADGALVNAQTPFDAERYLLTSYELPVTLQLAPGEDAFAAPYLPKYPGLLPTDGRWTFEPERISHNEIRLNDESGSAHLEVTLPLGHPIAQLFALEPPSAQVWLRLATLPSVGAAHTVIYSGRAREPDFGETTCTFTFAPLTDVLRRPGLTAKYSRFASGTLEEHADPLSISPQEPNAWNYYRYREDGFAATVSSDGLTLTVPEAANRPDGFFDDGLVVVRATYNDELAHAPRGTQQFLAPTKWDVPHGGVRRAVLTHTGTTLVLTTRLPPSINPADRVTLFCGVPATLDEYVARFGSAALFNGFPHLPKKNPYTGGIS